MALVLGFCLFAVAIVFVRLYPFKYSKFFLVLANFVAIYLLDISLSSLIILIVAVVLHYFLLKATSSRPKLAIFCYILPLSLVFLCKFPNIFVALGTSYLSFRMLSAYLEVTSKDVSMPKLEDYILYCFYFPSFKLGPIGNLKDHQDSFAIDRKWDDLDWIQLMRVLYGIIKMIFISKVVASFSSSIGYGSWDQVKNFGGSIYTGFFSYIHLYLEFSGFSDIVLGFSSFLRIKIKENFEQPFKSRNLSIYWTHWHISLGDLTKNLLFYPLNMHLQRKFGRKNSKYITPFVLILLFIAIGLWHGFATNYLLVGLYHGLGVVIVFYYSLYVAKRINDYESKTIFTYAGILVTQLYVSVSFLLFDNDFNNIVKILSRIFK